MAAKKPKKPPSDPQEPDFRLQSGDRTIMTVIRLGPDLTPSSDGIRAWLEPIAESGLRSLGSLVMSDRIIELWRFRK